MTGPPQHSLARRSNDPVMTPKIIRPHIFEEYAGLVAAVSTRLGGVSPSPLGLNMSYSVGDKESNVTRNRELFLGMLGFMNDQLATTKQVHGDTIAYVNTGGRYEGFDALVTEVPGILVSVSVADCVPILLFDPEHKVVAAVHAGWRGTARRIAVKAIASMVIRFGCDPPDILAFLGPSASACCYEVGEDVAVRFQPKYSRRTAGEGPHLDLKACNRDLLIESGVRHEHIEVSPDCTICGARLYHSYRRDGATSGRMLGVIGMRDPDTPR